MLLPSIHKLERSLSTTVMTTNIIYFYEKPMEKQHSQNMFLCVHYFSPFVEEATADTNGSSAPKAIMYNSCTQYYHYKKFEIIGAVKEAEEILSICEPEEAYDRSKVLEKKFFASPKWSIWEERKVSVMRNATRLKFEQNPVLMQKLLMTAGKMLIEDHPSDTFWYFAHIFWEYHK